ncbi:prenyl proteinase rce1 [Grosmannia clavigera kw1407]|uniref:intramembrane prenyl-peptidase Rce1 n=1 Tax=Grosmannia clavigera (strain kw1407 / UAMH 11150) TaxID=655863 RepID=F0XPQ8_GROCL|nr:prenyl proteinase rce1 [Grosmannia clavigera kw1407]EFX00198.1 prenyl proteinase rce1 [Grosmannia clavigera kw1407]
MPAIRGFIDKYIFHKEEIPPPISTGTAVALLALYTVAYVAPFYLSSLTRPSPTLSRDAPSVIRARITSVTLTCIGCSAATFVLLTTAGATGTTRLPATDALHLMGYLPVGLGDALRALALTAALFAGPLLELVLVEVQTWRLLRSDRSMLTCLVASLADNLADWTVWRNIVAGPVTEEVLFRGAGVPPLLLAHTSTACTVLLSPVVFGLAHLHHAYEFAVVHPRVPLAGVALRSLVQFAYTTLFGVYATFLFLRTGSLLAACLVHSFCNCMGLPRFWGRLELPRNDSDFETGRPRSNLLATLLYYVLLVAGAAYWYCHLWTLTASTNALVSFG